MSSEKIVERIHGGAVVVNNETVRLYQIRKKINENEKIRIAKAATILIEDNDVIYIDAGSTCFFLYADIQQKNITVFTSSLSILTHENENVSHLFALEGEVDRESFMIGGTLSIENLARINPTKIFFSTSALSKNYEILCDIDSLSVFMKKYLQMPAKKFLLMDSSKIGSSRAFKVGSINQVNTFITDDGIKQSDIEAIRALSPNMEIIIV